MFDRTVDIPVDDDFVARIPLTTTVYRARALIEAYMATFEGNEHLANQPVEKIGYRAGSRPRWFNQTKTLAEVGVVSGGFVICVMLAKKREGPEAYATGSGVGGMGR